MKFPVNGHLQTYVPYIKKGDRSLACNYRTVSLTCVPCQLLEHIFCSNIMAHLDEHKLLSDRQHAFRKKHSCDTQLITVIDDWVKILETKADRLTLSFWTLRKLSTHPLMNYLNMAMALVGRLKWIDSFLCDRQQCVIVNGVKSD